MVLNTIQKYWSIPRTCTGLEQVENNYGTQT